MNATIPCMTKKPAKTNDLPEGSKRLRLIVDIEDDRLSAAVQLRALKLSVARKRRVSKSEVVAEILAQELATELAELDKEVAKQAK